MDIKVKPSDKKKFSPLLMLILAVGFVTFGGFAFAQANKKSGIDALKEKVAVLGKLAFKGDVPINYVNKVRLKKYISAFFDKEYPEQLSRKENEFIRLMGFADNDANLDVRNIRKRIFLDNTGGLYNEETDELLVLVQYRELNYLNSMVLVHELRHALQDQYFNLAGILDSRSFSDFDDRRLAVLAAVEGDATFLMVQYSGLDADILASSPSSDALMSFLPTAKPSLLYREPEIIRNQLMMPYIHGLRFVSAVFKKKKWKGVNRILLLPPASTEQILHPEKYFKREAPKEVLIQYKPQGYQLFHSGVIGEYYLKVLVKSREDYTYKDYARGWGGDTFQIYKNADSYFLLWESVWDKDIYCSNFFSDFKRFIEKRFDVNLKNGNVKGIGFIAGKSDAREDYFFLMKLKDRIFYARSDNRDQMNALIYGGNYD
ncbi:MAG: hypothetical protein PVH61_05275 [Candidatus Aminicenantes bacterium]|jgi:hypothetical protein